MIDRIIAIIERITGVCLEFGPLRLRRKTDDDTP